MMLFLAPLGLYAGTITGTVKAKGPEVPSGVAGDAYESRKFKFVERVDYGKMKDFVVHLEGRFTNAPSPSAKPVQVLTQKDATFSPHVLPVMVGTTVEWPNRDEIYHNVFSESGPKTFNLGLYKDPEMPSVTFDKPGRVDVFCSIHTRMNCIILVLENPFFGATDARGRYAITNVPAGTYTVRAWHERLPAESRTVTVPDKGEVTVDFTLGVKIPPPAR